MSRTDPRDLTSPGTCRPTHAIRRATAPGALARARRAPHSCTAAGARPGASDGARPSVARRAHLPPAPARRAAPHAMKLSRGTLLVLLALTASSPGSGSGPLMELARVADRLAEAGRHEEAVVKYHAALSSGTIRHAEVAAFNLGLSLVELQRHTEAANRIRGRIRGHAEGAARAAGVAPPTTPHRKRARGCRRGVHTRTRRLGQRSSTLWRGGSPGLCRCNVAVQCW